MDAEAAVEWAFRRQAVRAAARAAGGLGPLLMAVLGGGELGRLHAPVGTGRGGDGVLAMMRRADLAGDRIDGSPASYDRGRVHPDAALVALAVRMLDAPLDRVVADLGEAGLRPDWGEGLPAEAEERTLTDLRGRPVEAVEWVDNRAGGLRPVAGPVTVTVGGARQIAALRAGYVAWYDALVEVARVLSFTGELRMRVLPPACQREPWKAGGGNGRARDRGYRLVAGADRDRFAEMARAGATRRELADAFGLTVRQAERMRRYVLYQS